jgi:hypothetical protein
MAAAACAAAAFRIAYAPAGWDASAFGPSMLMIPSVMM